MLNSHSERGDEKRPWVSSESLCLLLPGLFSGSLTAPRLSPWIGAGEARAGFRLSQARAAGAGPSLGLQEDVDRGQEEESGQRRRMQGKVPQQAGKQPGK